MFCSIFNRSLSFGEVLYQSWYRRSLSISISHRALHPPYGKEVIFLRAALLTEHSLRPSRALLFFPVSLFAFGSFHPLYRSISLLLFILSKIRKVSLKCVISLTLSHSFSLSVVWKAWKVNSSPLGGNRLHTDSLCKTQIHIL